MVKNTIKMFIWKIRFSYHFCRSLRTFKFWMWWGIPDSYIEQDYDVLDFDPKSMVEEELSYWTD